MIHACQNPSNNLLVVGSYTQKEGHVDGKGYGIYILDFNESTGQLSYIDSIAGFTNPSYLTMSDDGQNIYTVNETKDQTGTNATIHHLGLDDQGKYQIISEQKSSGIYPCHLSLDDSGNFLFVSNYGGSINAIKINSDSSLGPILDSLNIEKVDSFNTRQDAPHPHMLLPVYDDLVVLSDLGSNAITLFQMNQGKFKFKSRAYLNDQAGPRHLAYQDSTIYVLNELNNTIEVFKTRSSRNTLQRIQAIDLLDDMSTKDEINSAAIKIHPNKKFLYASNRDVISGTNNSISVFEINDSNHLTKVQEKDSGGLIPRDFAISPDGQFILVGHQDSNNIKTFKIEQSTGKILELNQTFKIATPVCLRFSY